MIFDVIRDDLVASAVGFIAGFGACWMWFTETSRPARPRRRNQ